MKQSTHITIDQFMRANKARPLLRTTALPRCSHRIGPKVAAIAQLVEQKLEELVSRARGEA